MMGGCVIMHVSICSVCMGWVCVWGDVVCVSCLLRYVCVSMTISA